MTTGALAYRSAAHDKPWFRAEAVAAAVVPLALGLVLLTAAVAKSLSPAPDLSLVGARYAIWFQSLEIMVELGIGACLVSRIWPVQASGAATLLFLALGCVSFWKAYFLGITNCGCFGAAITLSPWYSGAISLAAAGSLLWLEPAALKVLAPASNGLRLAVVAPFFLSLAGWTTFLTAANWPTLLDDSGQQIAEGKHVLLDPPAWVGKRFPLLTHIDRGRSLAEGEWLVVLYHHECGKCRELLSRIDEQLRQGGVLPGALALVQIPPYGLATQMTDVPQQPLIHAYLRAGPVWHVQTPTFLLLKDGEVVSIAREEDILPRGTP